MKKLLKIFGIVIGCLLLVLILVPILFKGALVDAVKTELNKSIDAKVEFEDVGISLIRNFPHLNLRLYELNVTGIDEFEGVSLADVEFIGLTFNLSSLWKKDAPYELRGLDIESPNIQLITLANGQRNYQIIAESEEEIAEEQSESGGFALDLKSYSISNGQFSLEDRSTNTNLVMSGMNHSGSGNFTSDIFEWASSTDISAASVTYDGLSYLSEVPIKWDITLDVDLNERLLTIAENELFLSELQLDLDGLIRFPEDEDLFMDLEFGAPGNDFIELFSVLPIAKLADIKEVRAEGTFDLKGDIQGSYNGETETYPSFNLLAEIENGFVQYPGMELPLESVFFNAKVNSPDENLDHMTIDISSFSLQAGGNPVSGRLFVKNPISDPFIETELKGKLDLGDIQRIFPMEDVETLKGLLDIDIYSTLVLSDVEKEAYENIELRGDLAITDFTMEMQGMPNLAIPSAGLALSKTETVFRPSSLQIGTNDLELEGTMGNVFLLFGENKPLRGNLIVRSNRFDIDEIMESFSGEEVASDGPKLAGDTLVNISPFYNVDFDLTVLASEIIFRPYFIRNVDAQLNLKPQTIDARRVSLVINDSDAKGSIAIQNWYEFAMADERMTIDADIEFGTLDIDKIMDYSDSAESNDSGERQAGEDNNEIPAFRYNIHLAGTADRVIYSPYDIGRVDAMVYLTEQDIHIREFTGNLYGDVLSGSGFIGNYMGYVYLDQTLSGELEINSRGLDLNNLMEAMMAEEEGVASAQVSSEEFEPILIPSNLDFGIKGNLGNLSYFNMLFKGVTGVLNIKNGSLEIEDFKGNIFNGAMVLNGVYDTSDDKPQLKMRYDIERLDIPTSFQSIQTIASIAPIFEFMNGRFNSTLVLESELGEGMMPIWNTLNADGFIKTMDAYVVNLPPLRQAADKLKVDLFDRIDFNNVENWFEIKNGTFDLKAVEHLIGESVLEFMGSHQIGGNMDYVINASIPKDAIGSGAVGSAVSSGLDFIQKEASQLGFDVASGSHIDVAINLRGKLKDPEVGVKFLGVSSTEDLKDRSEKVIRDQIEEETEKIRDRAEEEVDQAREEVEQRVDSLKQKAEERGKEAVEKAKEEAGSKIKEFLQDTSKGKEDAKEDIKKKIKNFNPFKKGSDDDG